jgi:hypothetical protein
LLYCPVEVRGEGGQEAADYRQQRKRKEQAFLGTSRITVLDFTKLRVIHVAIPTAAQDKITEK